MDQENRDLRSILKQYLDGITVTADAVDGPNPLLVVNGKVNLNQARWSEGGGAIVARNNSDDANHDSFFTIATICFGSIIGDDFFTMFHKHAKIIVSTNVSREMPFF